MTSIKDVARSVGVSTATVSRALRGLPRVSDITRDRVLQAAADLHYVPSPSASALAGGRTRAVGVVVPFVSRWFFASVVQGAEALFRRAGYDLVLYNLAGDPDSRRRVFEGHLLRRRVDAVLVLSLTPNAAEVAALSLLQRPVALIGAAVPGWASVRIDDRRAACTAMGHLLSLGHRRIAHLGGVMADHLDFAAPRDRLAGYRHSMATAGLDVRRGWEAEADFTVHGGARAMTALLRADPRDRPTAVFAASDEMAIGAVAAVRRSGLRVPEDISVIGVDDHEMAEFFELTTVAQPTRDQGRLAAEMLLAAMENGAPMDAAPPSRVVPTTLVVRATTAAPPATDA